MATSTSFSTITSLLYELSSSLYYQWSVFFFTLFSLVCVCFFLLMCVCVCSPTFFLSSCEAKDKLSHSLYRAHMKIRRASLHYWRSMVCVCEAHHWSLKSPWCLVCMHRSEIVGECCLECSSGLTNASLHLIKWGNEKYLCVCFGVCVCVCRECSWITIGHCSLSGWEELPCSPIWAVSLDWQGIQTPIVGQDRTTYS